MIEPRLLIKRLREERQEFAVCHSHNYKSEMGQKVFEDVIEAYTRRILRLVEMDGVA